VTDFYRRPLGWADRAGSAVASTTSETTLLPNTGPFTIPAGELNFRGKMLAIRAAGKISTVVTTPGTLTFKVKFGSIAVATSQAMPLNIVAKTNVFWELDILMTLRDPGISTAANFMTNGSWRSEAVIGSPAASAGGIGVQGWQASAPAVGTGFDSSINNLCDLTATWSVSSGSNSITLEQFLCEAIN
jgi:hypothetical protein